MNVTRYTAKITTVDPTTSTVGFIVKGDAQERYATILTTPVAFRWPIEGETWLVRQENGSWYIDGMAPNNLFTTFAPGDAIIDSPTGVVHVVSGENVITFDWTGSTIQFYLNGNPVTVA